MRRCDRDDCNRTHYGRGFCYKHYREWLNEQRSLRRYPLDDPGYSAVHRRIYTKRGKAKDHKCVDCGKQAAQWSYKKRKGTSGNPEDYDPRCVECHNAYDWSLIEYS